METTKLAFLKVKKIKKGEDFLSVEGRLCTSMDDLVDDIRMCYARDLYWIKERFFYDDVETPEQDVSIDEFQTEEGQDKAWNKHLSDLITSKENGLLLGYEPLADDNQGRINQIILVLDIGGQEVFFEDDTSRYGSDITNIFEFENVTSEYFDKFMRAIDKDEIEEYVNTHTQDEIEEKYISRWTKEHNDTFSMWEW